MIGAGLVFFGRENATEHWAGFKDVEPLPTDARAAHAQRKIAAGVIKAAVILHGRGGENFLVVADVSEVRRGDHDTFEIKFFVARANGGETLGMRNTGGMEEQGVQRAEDGGVGANSETESEYRDGGEGGIFEERANGVTKILKKVVHWPSREKDTRGAGLMFRKKIGRTRPRRFGRNDRVWA